MAQIIGSFLNRFFSPEFVVFLISLLPVLELRGGMIAAALFNMPWHTALLIAIVGNVLPIYFVITSLEGLLKKMKGIKMLSGAANWIESKGAKQGAMLSKEYPAQLYIGLMMFVAVPLPGTGAWTGALIASLLGLNPKKSGLFICLGILIAGLFMSVVAYVIPMLLKQI